MVAFLFGIAFAILSIGIMHWCRVAHQRGTWAAMMLAIAGFYVVFSLDHGIGEIEHFAIAGAFSALAIIGARFNAWLIVVVLLGHGIFDVSAHLFVPDPSPEWWGPFCIGVDIIWGLWLAVLIVQKRIKVPEA